jgi:hypothetical protein
VDIRSHVIMGSLDRLGVQAHPIGPLALGLVSPRAPLVELLDDYSLGLGPRGTAPDSMCVIRTSR